MALDPSPYPTWKPEKVATFFIGHRKASSAQVAKYNQVLEAAYRIVDEQGYEAFQMRAIAEESGVALATIYRYFKSRDYLAFVMSTAWIAEVTGSVGFSPDQPSSLGEAKETIYKTAARLKEHPNLLRTFARSVLTSDPFVTAERSHVSRSFAFEPPQGVNADDWGTTVRYMDKVYLTGLLRWTYGQQDYNDIADDICGIMELCARALNLFGDSGAYENRVLESGS